MMKEFRFEPASQMITVEEGQNLGIDITGIKTAYRCDDGAQRVICHHGFFLRGEKAFFLFTEAQASHYWFPGGHFESNSY